MNLLQGMGQAKPVSEFINTAGQYQTTQSNLETQKLQQQKMQAEALQLKKDNTEYHPDAVLTMFPEHTRPFIKEAWQSGGAIDPSSGMIRSKDIRNTQTFILNNQKASESLLTAEYEQLSKKAATLSKKTDPESQQEALGVVSQMTAIEKVRRLGKEKQNTVVPAGASVMDAEGKIISTAPKENKVKKTFSSPEVGNVNQLEDGTLEVVATKQPFSGDPNTLHEIGAPKEQANPQAMYMTADRVIRDPASTPAQIAAAKGDQTAALKIMTAMGEARGAGFAMTRGKDMIDTKDGSVLTMNWSEINDANKRFPGRFKPATPFGAASAAPGSAGLSMAEQLANFKGKTDPVNIRSVQLINALDDPTNKLRDMAHKLPLDTGIQVINNVLREGSMQVGGVAVNNWDTFVIEYTKEVNRAMTGVGSVSEKLITQQQEVLKKSKTLGQMLGALDQIEFALHARRKAVMEPIYKGAKSPVKSGPLSVDEAKTYLRLSGGDKEKARQMAVEDGRTF